jgi:HEAT repeat protein
VLSEFREQPVTNELLALAKKGGSTIKLAKIIETLGMLKDPSSVPYLVQSLGNSSLRIAATSALSRLGPKAIPSLEAAIRESKGVPRRLAQKILDQLSKVR